MNQDPKSRNPTDASKPATRNSNQTPTLLDEGSPEQEQDERHHAAEDNYWDYCPNCSSRLHNVGCKYRCPNCHYFMSCSDFD